MEIETERLILRNFKLEDVPAIFEYRSNPEIAKFQSSAHNTLEKTKKFVEELKDLEWCWIGGWSQIGIELKSEQKIIGDIGINRKTEQPKIIDIGYTMHPQYQKKGYTKEAVKALVKVLFEQFEIHKMMAILDPINVASSSLATSVGFVKEGFFRKHYWDEMNKEWQDECYYGLLKKDLKKSDCNVLR